MWYQSNELEKFIPTRNYQKKGHLINARFIRIPNYLLTLSCTLITSQTNYQKMYFCACITNKGKKKIFFPITVNVVF